MNQKNSNQGASINGRLVLSCRRKFFKLMIERPTLGAGQECLWIS